MSSKSRYNKESNTPSSTVDHVDGGTANAPTMEEFEEYVHVPEGRSRTQFILLVGLMIFLLIVFIIPAAFQQTLTGGGGDEFPAVAYETAGGEFSMSSADFYTAKRLDDSFRRVATPWLRKTPTHEETATTLLLDTLAREAGVRVSDQDLRDSLIQLAEQIGGKDAYTQYLQASFPGGAAAFERTVRRGIRINRFLELTTRLAAAPTADRVELAWLEEHKEYAFDYLFVETSLFEDAAKALEPTDEVLQTWIDARPTWELNQLKSAEAWSLGSAFFRFDQAAPDALLAKYPLADDFDVEAAGASFYTSNSYLVYQLDEPRTDEDGNEIRYAPLEEVADSAQAAARVEAALAMWRDDVAARSAAGEDVDLALEAQELGLGWRETPGPQERQALVTDQEFGGGILTSQLPTLSPGDVAGSVIVTKEVLQVVELIEHIEPVLPPLADIREEVLNRWARENSNELAVDFLTELVGDATNLDAEAAMALAASDERIQSGRRDWLDRAAPADADPDAFEAGNLFVRTQAGQLGLYELGEGDLSAVTLSSTRDRVYLVRSLGSRDLEFSQATPAEVAAIEGLVMNEARMDLRTAYIGDAEGELSAFLVENYKLRLPASEESERKRLEEEAKEQAGEPTEG